MKSQFEELNSDQMALAQWIYAGLKIPEIHNGFGDAGYLLSNMIAKYSLASSVYLLSEGAVNTLSADHVDLSNVYKRSKFHGKKSPFIYEHAIPVSIVRDKLFSSDLSKEDVFSVLKACGPVAMILRDEDQILNQYGLQRKMPDGWVWGDSPLARYQVAGIEIAIEFIRVEGRLMR